MKNYLSIAAAGLLIASACNRPAPALTGTIDGWHNDTLYAEWNEADRRRIDTLIAVDGRFTYDVAFARPTALYLYRRDRGEMQQAVYLTLFPGRPVAIRGRQTDSVLYYQAEGYVYNETESRFREASLPLLTEAGRWQLKADSLGEEIEKRFENQPADPEMDRLLQQRQEAEKQARTPFARIRQQKLDYAKAHLDEDIAFAFLSIQPRDTAYHYLYRLSDKVLNGPFQKEIDEYLRRSWVGNTFADFTLEGADGAPVSLSATGGKYVVIEFWGSFCSTCKEGFHRMNRYYRQYGDRIEFIGVVPRNDDRQWWKNNIAKYNLTWPQGVDNDSCDLIRQYDIYTYPTKIILSPHKKIIAAYMAECDLFYQKLDALMAQPVSEK